MPPTSAKSTPRGKRRRQAARLLVPQLEPVKRPVNRKSADAEVQKVVTFRSTSRKKNSPFTWRHVREILRVQTPNQVPDVPDYDILGVLTVRGHILPVIDLAATASAALYPLATMNSSTIAGRCAKRR